ncbi:hypothetical protein ACQ86G_21520 [Roseateles chitinivorans]|uniref:hypothetical protein n=1 Tax=Roseateles chitinivorans TaxID=2917965 RepID=UPI003D667D30
MNTNQLMTIGAVGFAGFALYYITRTPGKTLASQPGQQQRDAGLQQWIDQQLPTDWYKSGVFDYSARVTPALNGSALFGTGYLF